MIPERMLIFVLSCLMAFAMVFAITPSAIRIARMKGLVANPDHRSSHKNSTPIVGGVPIFLGVIFSVLLLTPTTQWGQLQYILAALVIVFLVGLKDDVEDLSPKRKVIGLLLACAVLVVRGGVCLQGMYGLLGISGDFPEWLGLLISAFTLLVITNAFNLIDGINGLSGTVGAIICISFGIWFFMVEETYLGILSMATAGSLAAFLRYNITPAETFMGDTGALVVGLIISTLAIKFIDLASIAQADSPYGFKNPIAITVATLIIPLFDTIRVFSTRIMRGGSPFEPDRRHIHHLLIDSGWKHLEATAILGIVNLVFITATLALDPLLDLHTLLALQIGTALASTYFLHRNVQRLKAAAAKNALKATKS